MKEKIFRKGFNSITFILIISQFSIINSGCSKSYYAVSNTRQETVIDRSKVEKYEYRIENVTTESDKEPILKLRVYKVPYYTKNTYTVTPLMESKVKSPWMPFAGTALGALFLWAGISNNTTGGYVFGLICLPLSIYMMLFPNWEEPQEINTKKVITFKESAPLEEYKEICKERIKIAAALGNTVKTFEISDGVLNINLTEDLGLREVSSDEKVQVKVSSNQISLTGEYNINPLNWMYPFIRIAGDNTNIFETPGNGKVTGKIASGEEFRILEERFDYLRVEYGTRSTSWVKKTAGERFWSLPERFDPKNPPSLEIKSIVFEEPSKEGYLDAEETGRIKIEIQNSGKSPAHRLSAKLTDLAKNGANLKYTAQSSLGTILPGKTSMFEIPLTAPYNIASAEQKFKIMITEANGYDAEPIEIAFKTRAFREPALFLADQGVEDANNNGMIEIGESIDITARIQNKGEGDAGDVTATVNIEGEGQNLFYTTPIRTFALGTMKSGEFKDVKFTVATNKRFSSEKLPISISLEEEHRSFNKTFALNLPLKKSMNKIHELLVKAEDKNVTMPRIESLSIDIETRIPEAKQKNPNAIALIIAISDYQNPDVPKVEFAERDAAFMRQYLEKTLGYDQRNILPANQTSGMTLGTMKTYIKNILPSFLKPDGTSELFIYYVGHGAPSTKEQEAFFVPYDCNPSYVNRENAYSVKEFYSDIRELKASKKIVVVDACFSGQAGDGKMLIKNASPIYLTVNNQLAMEEKSIIFQSSGSNQVSNWYPEKQHSMFTYFFLKGLQGGADKNSDGSITAGEMEAFINDENEGLPYWSNRKFQRPQKAVISGAKDNIITIMK